MPREVFELMRAHWRRAPCSSRSPGRLPARPGLPDLPRARPVHVCEGPGAARPGRPAERRAQPAGLSVGSAPLRSGRRRRSGLPLLPRPPAAPGAVGCRSTGAAGSAAPPPCGRRWSGRSGRPRSWARRSPTLRSASHAAAPCWTPCPTTPAIVVATPGAEPRRRRAVTPARSCSTPRCCCSAPTCGPARRPCVVGSTWWPSSAAARTGGAVVAAGESSGRALQALVRLDPAGLARRELGERAEARFPPAVKMVTVEGRTGVAGGVSRARPAASERRAAGAGRARTAATQRAGPAPADAAGPSRRGRGPGPGRQGRDAPSAAPARVRVRCGSGSTRWRWDEARLTPRTAGAGTIAPRR